MSDLQKALAAKVAAKLSQEPEATEKAAHELALEKGIPVARSLRIRRLILRNGNAVLPTPEGFFIALNEEIAEQLQHYSKGFGLVELILPEAPKEEKKQEEKK